MRATLTLGPLVRLHALLREIHKAVLRLSYQHTLPRALWNRQTMVEMVEDGEECWVESATGDDVMRVYL